MTQDGETTGKQESEYKLSRLHIPTVLDRRGEPPCMEVGMQGGEAIIVDMLVNHLGWLLGRKFDAKTGDVQGSPSR